MTLADLSSVELLAMGVAAALVGFAKTGIPGTGVLSVALFATVLPARASTGVVLPLLILGDVLAVSTYHRSAHWPTLLRLAGPMVVGILAGVAFVAVADDVAMRRTIGVILLVLIAVHVLVARRPAEPREQGRLAHWGYGWLGGFTTMVANAAGPVLSLYLLGSRFDKYAFLGTIAWFFAFVNLVKLPFSIGLGLVTVDSLTLNLVLVPAVLLGAYVGRPVARRLDQATFERAVLVLSALGALNLVR